MHQIRYVHPITITNEIVETEKRGNYNHNHNNNTITGKMAMFDDKPLYIQKGTYNPHTYTNKVGEKGMNNNLG